MPRTVKRQWKTSHVTAKADGKDAFTKIKKKIIYRMNKEKPQAHFPWLSFNIQTEIAVVTAMAKAAHKPELVGAKIVSYHPNTRDNGEKRKNVRSSIHISSKFD